METPSEIFARDVLDAVRRRCPAPDWFCLAADGPAGACFAVRMNGAQEGDADVFVPVRSRGYWTGFGTYLKNRVRDRYRFFSHVHAVAAPGAVASGDIPEGWGLSFLDGEYLRTEVQPVRRVPLRGEFFSPTAMTVLEACRKRMAADEARRAEITDAAGKLRSQLRDARLQLRDYGNDSRSAERMDMAFMDVFGMSWTACMDMMEAVDGRTAAQRAAQVMALSQRLAAFGGLDLMRRHAETFLESLDAVAAAPAAGISEVAEPDSGDAGISCDP